MSASTVYLIRSLGTVWGVSATSAIVQTTLTNRLPSALRGIPYENDVSIFPAMSCDIIDADHVPGDRPDPTFCSSDPLPCTRSTIESSPRLLRWPPIRIRGFDCCRLLGHHCCVLCFRKWASENAQVMRVRRITNSNLRFYNIILVWCVCSFLDPITRAL